MVLAAALAANLSGTCGLDYAVAQEVAQQQAPAVSCGGATIGRGTVQRIMDGRTLALDDGREVRLAAIEVPMPAIPPPYPPPQAGEGREGAAAPGGSDAKAALDALVGGDTVLLRQAEIGTDRYGRLVAYVSAVRDGDEIFAQGEMIASGFARVADDVGSRQCATDLMAREAAARNARLGLWANDYYDVLDAKSPADVLARRGRFALVEGKVDSVHESGATVYVNFGRHWSEDFTVTVPKRNERSFAAAGLDLKGLAGRLVLVRGWIEARGSAGSPWIEAAHPEQIAIADSK
jgi:endonuclease YncB( thermonuclease family)